jgi:hypothetical protein
MIRVRILADSITPRGHRLTTMLWVYPRFIHDEVLTHRMLSRNAASSRAIPVERMCAAVEAEPAEPVAWYANGKGMQSRELLDGKLAGAARSVWLHGASQAVLTARELAYIPVHKSIANRPLLPYQHSETLVSATEWPNLFAQRAHPDAQPEFAELAYQALDAYLASVPVLRQPSEWHIPFGDQMYPEAGLKGQIAVATARAGRLSYATHDGDFSIGADIGLHDRLTDPARGHWSPTEHPAEAMDDDAWYGNYRGWRQYRKTFAHENRTWADVRDRQGRPVLDRLPPGQARA